MDATLYELLAGLLLYPEAGFTEDVARVNALLVEDHPAAHRVFEPFVRLLPADDLHAMQELHARTFDVQAITTLDVGYVLFGEDYKRGALLANLSREHREVGNDCSTELADHLPNVLRLLPRMTDAAVREELVKVLLDPAVKRMIAEFGAERLARGT